MIIYLSGPMSGYPQHNFPAFNRAAEQLRDAGYTVINPAEIEQPIGADWETCMSNDIREMLKADVVATLPGWQVSRGARVETTLARQLGKQVVELAALVCEEVV